MCLQTHACCLKSKDIWTTTDVGQMFACHLLRICTPIHGYDEIGPSYDLALSDLIYDENKSYQFLHVVSSIVEISDTLSRL